MEPETKRQRLIEAAAVALRAAPGRSLGRVQLNKALFYADLVALLELGRPITGAKYVAIEAGPVVSDYKRTLLKRLVKSNVAEVDGLADDGMTKPVVLKDEPHYSLLDKDEREILTRYGHLASQFTASALSDISHENPGWKLAWDTGRGGGDGVRVINMRIALQQLVDDDTWLTAPADEALDQAFQEAESGATDPWE